MAPHLDLRVPHPRSGSTAADELAFTLGNGFAYVELVTQAGWPSTSSPLA